MKMRAPYRRDRGQKQAGYRRGFNPANMWEQGVKGIVDQFTRLRNRYFLPRYLRSMKKLKAGLSGGNRIRIFTDGDTFYSQFVKSVKSARKSVNLETYIFKSDDAGWEMAEILVDRARHGVEVNCIYDAVGCMGTSPSLFAYLKDGGVEVVEYNPILPWRKSFALGLRDHRKILVVDGKTAYVGGNNIGDEYAGSRYNGPDWRDTHVRIEGPAVREVQHIFMENWYRCGGALMNIHDHVQPLRPVGKKMVMVLGSRARNRNIRPIIESYLSAIDSAREKIFITNAYFVPTRSIYQALSAASERGVDVRIMMPHDSDVKIAQLAGHYLYKRYLKKGIRILEYHRTMLHAKTAVIDGIWTTIGSSNLDGVTIRRNLEINTVILDQDTGLEMERIFERDMEHCHEITMAEWHRRPFLIFALEWLAYHLLKML